MGGVGGGLISDGNDGSDTSDALPHTPRQCVV